MKAIRTIGFTGTIASGKSSRCKHLVEVAKKHQRDFIAAASISNKPPTNTSQSATAPPGRTADSQPDQHANNSVLVHYINADLVGHNIYEPGKPCYKALIHHFGSAILSRAPPPPPPQPIKEPTDTAAAGTAPLTAPPTDAPPLIDRRVLGGIVFSDERKLQELNAICWPYISDAIRAEHAAVIARATAAAFPAGLDPTAQLRVPPGPPAAVALIIIEAALLCEMTPVLNTTTDLWMTHCTPITAIDRLMARNALSREAAEQRVASQREIGEKLQALRELSYKGDIEVFDTTSVSLKEGLKETEDAFEKYWRKKVLVHLSHNSIE